METEFSERASDIGPSIFRVFKRLGPAASGFKQTVGTPET